AHWWCVGITSSPARRLLRSEASPLGHRLRPRLIQQEDIMSSTTTKTATRIVACLTFQNHANALEGMQILESLGYRSVELEIVDQADANTVFIEGSKPLPVGFDEYAEPDYGFDEIFKAVGHLGDVCEAGLADDTKIDWCGQPASPTATGAIACEKDG